MQHIDYIAATKMDSSTDPLNWLQRFAVTQSNPIDK